VFALQFPQRRADGAPVNTHACDPRANHLLGALPPTDWRRWVPLLEPVDLPLGKVLYGSGAS